MYLNLTLLIYKVLSSVSYTLIPKCHGMFETEVHDLLERVIAIFDEAGVDYADVRFESSRSTGISKEVEIASGETAFRCISPYLRFKDVQVEGN